MRVRPLTEADIPSVVPIVNEATPERPVDEEEIRSWLVAPEIELEVTLVENDSGEPVAYADLACPKLPPDRASLDAQIPPRVLEAGVASEVLDWAEATALEHGRSVLRAYVAHDAGLVPFLGARGFRPIRSNFHMRIDLEAPPPRPAWPDGIGVTPVRPGEERVVHEASDEAFADHWDHTPHSYEEFLHYFVNTGDNDPSLWFVARDGEQIAGLCLCTPTRAGRPGMGWVRVLAVRRPWRRRGLGLALLLHAFGAFWARGIRAVGLGVDGENTTGAVRLYEKAGMFVEHRFDTYEKHLQ